MAVLRGVANVLLFRLANTGKARFQGGMDFTGIVHAQGGLCHHRQFFGLQRLYASHIVQVFHQMDAAVQLAHGAFNLGVAFMPDHDEFIAFLCQFGHFHMHFGHQWAGGIKNAEAALPRFFLHGLANPVRRENQRCARRHIG